MRQTTSTSIDTTDDLQDVLDQEVIAEQELDEIKKKSISGVVSFVLRTAVIQGIGLASAFILSYFFSPEDFGVYGFILQIIGLLIFFSDVGLAAVLVQKKEEPTLTEYRTAFTVQQLLSWLIFGVTLALAFSGAVRSKTGMVGVWILLSLGLSFPLASLKTISSIKLERQLLFSRLVIPQILEQLAFHGILIVLAWKQWGAIAYAYAIIVRSVIGTLSMWWLEPWALGMSWEKSALKTLLGYGVKFQANDLLARIKDQFFFLVVGIFLPLNQFGYIQWAKNWSMYPYNLTVQNVMAITFPTFSRLQGHKQALKRAIEKSLFFISITIFPLLIGMSVMIGPLVHVIAKYEKWQPALLSLVFFCLSIAWGAISTPLTNTLNAIGHIDQTLKLMIMWTVLTWVITPMMVWFFGYNGVALAAFVISFSSIVAIWYVKKVVPIDVWGQVWPALLSASVMAAIGVAGQDFWQQSLKHLGMGILILGGVYTLTLMAVSFEKLKVEILSLRKR